MSLNEIIDQRIEFENHPQCPACGYMDHAFEFTTGRSLRDGSGRFTADVTTMGAAPDPHLIITCSRCGLERQMETYR